MGLSAQFVEILEVLRFIPIIGCLLLGSLLTAQDVTIINRYDSKSDELSDEDYVLKQVTEHRYVINHYEPSNTGPRSHLEQMISYGLRSYVDNQYHVFEGRVEALASPAAYEEDASEIVRNAIWIHDLPFADEFPGFSEKVDVLVEVLTAMDGDRVLFGDSDNRKSSNGSVGLYTFQRAVYDLKIASEREVIQFLDQQIPNTKVRGYDESETAFLNPKNFQIQPSTSNEVALEALKPDPSLLFDEKEKKKKKRGKDESPFTERIVELLEENNRILSNYNTRFEDLQNQINEIREGGGRNDDIRDEIAELRAMIIDLAQGKTITESDGSKTRLVPNERVVVYFDKNIHDLNLAQKAKLNRVELTLIENPGYTAVITGYADKSGSAGLNAWISKERANSVREYLLSRGIPKTRIVINFLGDEESLSPNPEDRKVEVQYILNYVAEE